MRATTTAAINKNAYSIELVNAKHGCCGQGKALKSFSAFREMCKKGAYQRQGRAAMPFSSETILFTQIFSCKFAFHRENSEGQRKHLLVPPKRFFALQISQSALLKDKESINTSRTHPAGGLCCSQEIIFLFIVEVCVYCLAFIWQ